MTDTERKGKMGEIAAARYLRGEGLEIICVNYRTFSGEIDIIAEDGDTVVFAEVKTRSPDTRNRPAFSVDYRKQKKIILTAQQFIKSFTSGHKYRFDIIEVFMGEDDDQNTAVVNHIRNAFTVRKNGYF